MMIMMIMIIVLLIMITVIMIGRIPPQAVREAQDEEEESDN